MHNLFHILLIPIILVIGLIYKFVQNLFIRRSNDGPLIEFKKTICFGTCPIYNAKIYKNGYMEYIGEEHVPVLGVKRVNMDMNDLTRIINKINEVHFFRLDDNYDGEVTDLPSTYITVNMNGKSKTIRARYEYPNQLDELIKLIHNTIIHTIN